MGNQHVAGVVAVSKDLMEMAIVIDQHGDINLEWGWLSFTLTFGCGVHWMVLRLGRARHRVRGRRCIWL
jgi:hypothetical protein